MLSRRPSYRPTDERRAEQMVHVMGGFACSTVATVYVKSLSEITSLVDFSVALISDRSLAQQKDKSKSDLSDVQTRYCKCWLH